MKKSIRPNQIIKELVAIGSDVIILKGYIGEETNEKLPLFRSFNLNEKIEIYKKNIVHMELSDNDTLPSTIYIEKSSKVDVIHRKIVENLLTNECSDNTINLVPLRKPAPPITGDSHANACGGIRKEAQDLVKEYGNASTSRRDEILTKLEKLGNTWDNINCRSRFGDVTSLPGEIPSKIDIPFWIRLLGIYSNSQF